MNDYKTSEFKHTYMLKWIRGYTVSDYKCILKADTRIRGNTVSDYKCMKKWIRGYMDTQSVIISVF